LASIAVGGVAVVVLLLTRGIESDAPIYGGLGLSVAVYIIISLLSPRGVNLATAAQSRAEP
jgi:SSS family solute:Na+ symporter